MRIAYFVHGRGRGHASRAQTIVPALTEDGHDLRLFAGDQAIDLLAGLSVAAINSVKPGLRGTLLIPGRLGHDRAELKKSKPDLVISDGDAPSLVAARSLGIPTLAIGHDLVFTGCQLPSDLPTGALRAERRSALFASRLGTRGVAVHFLPIQPARSEIVCARPSLRQELSGTPPSSVGGIVSYFRDRNGRHCVSLAAKLGAQVQAFGDPTLELAGVECRGFEPDAFARELLSCSAIMASSGSNLCAEAVLLGKPMLALYKARDTEQHLNALLLERAGVAMACSFEKLKESTVERFLERVQAGDFERVDLADAMPETTRVVRELVTEHFA